MIELFSADTPNGKKISIMLEEIGFDYKVTKVDLGKKEQFHPEFKSRPDEPSPLHLGLVKASLDHKKSG